MKRTKKHQPLSQKNYHVISVPRVENSRTGNFTFPLSTLNELEKDYLFKQKLNGKFVWKVLKHDYVKEHYMVGYSKKKNTIFGMITDHNIVNFN